MEAEVEPLLGVLEQLAVLGLEVRQGQRRGLHLGPLHARRDTCQWGLVSGAKIDSASSMSRTGARGKQEGMELHVAEQ